MNLPFQFGEALAPDRMVDRDVEVADVSRAMTWGERLFLIGPRRFGKSTILRAARTRAEAGGTPVLSVNAERYADLNELAADLIGQAGAVRKADPSVVAGRVTKFFSRLRPQVSYDVITNSWSASIIPERGAPASKTLAQVLDDINLLAGALETRIAIVIDEFQAISIIEGVPAEQRLRSVVQMHDHLSYVFAGSDTSLMIKMVSDHARPFYRLGRNLYVREVPRPDFRKFLDAQLRRVFTEVEPAAIESIMDAAADVPYSVQQLAMWVWTSGAAESEGISLTTDYVTTAYSSFLQREGVTFGALYNSLPRQQARVAKALADTALQPLPTQKSLAEYAAVAVSTFRTARQGLLDKAILREDIYAAPNTDASEVFVDPFFAEWLRREIVKR